MSRYLISLSTLDTKRNKYYAEDGVLKVSKGSLVVMKADLKSANLYVLRGSSFSANVVVAPNSETTKIWHMCLGHMSALGMSELKKRGLLNGCHSDTLDSCEHCIFSNHKRVKFSLGIHNTKNILDYLHADLWGPSPKVSLSGAHYMLTVIDDYSHRVRSYFLKHKSVAFESFKASKVMVEKQTKRKLKVLVINNGKEFCSADFKSFGKKEGIIRHHTV
jgi:hypothetical protein